MLYSAIGYLLTFFMAFTIIPLIAFLLRMLLIMLFTRIYWGITGDKSPVGLLQFSIKLAHPVGFLTAIFHGFAALWMGVVFFKGLDLPVDYFLPAILSFTFLWFGLRNLNNPSAVRVDNKFTTRNSDGEETTIILHPDAQDNPMHEDPMQQFNDQIKNQLKDQTKEFMQGNTIIGLIGKVTGVILGTLYHILPIL